MTTEKADELQGFMTIAEAGDYLALSRARINQLIDRGDLPVMVLGERTRRVPRRAVVELGERLLTTSAGGAS
jgi:excisionase family DNA binding protein